jgi:hypothetical protein
MHHAQNLCMNLLHALCINAFDVQDMEENLDVEEQGGQIYSRFNLEFHRKNT